MSWLARKCDGSFSFRLAAAAMLLAIVSLGSLAKADVINPKDIDGLQLWLNADSITGVSNGGHVGAWADSSGNGNNYAKTGDDNQPVYVASGLNGHAVVRFNGGETLGSNFHPDTAFSLFAVVKANATGASNTNANRAYFGGGSGAMAFGIYTGSLTPANSFWAWAPNEYSTYGLAGSANNDANIQAYVVPGTEETSWSWYLNGAKTGAAGYTSGTPTAYSGQTFVGWDGIATDTVNGPEAWNGDIAEVLVYNGVLSETQVGQVNAYLQAKYIATPEPSAIAMGVTGVIGLLAYAWRKRK